MEPDGGIERELLERGFGLVAGADEVGRGALAGPLVAAAVILPHPFDLPGLQDSKLLAPSTRERLSREIRAQAISISVVRITNRVIDRRGLGRSNQRALRAAIARLSPVPDYALTDGLFSRSPVHIRRAADEFLFAAEACEAREAWQDAGDLMARVVALEPNDVRHAQPVEPVVARLGRHRP